MAKPKTVKKDPFSTEDLIILCDKYLDCKDFIVVRNLTMILLGFAWFFLRYDEFSSVRCKDVTFHDDFKVAYTSGPIFEKIMKRYPIFSVQKIDHQIDQKHK